VQGGAIEIAKVRTESGRKLSAADLGTARGLKVGDRLESQAAPNFAAAQIKACLPKVGPVSG